MNKELPFSWEKVSPMRHMHKVITLLIALTAAGCAFGQQQTSTALAGEPS